MHKFWDDNFVKEYFGEPWYKVGSLSLAERLMGFELGTFKF